MKKGLFILLFALISFSVSAQFGRAIKIPLAVGDTAVNATPVNKIFTATAGYNSVAVQPVFTKVSGTIAGEAVLLGSLDGVNYVAVGDTLTLTNVATNTAIWVHDNTPYVYYKVKLTGSGTMNGILAVWYTLRKTLTQ